MTQLADALRVQDELWRKLKFSPTPEARDAYIAQLTVNYMAGWWSRNAYQCAFRGAHELVPEEKSS